MDKKDFGQLVAMLRKETRNEFDEPMTQYDLAELARIPLITLQKIEQGRQENIKPETLLKLLRALNLSSQARYIFLLASLGLQDSEILKPNATIEMALGELTRTLSQLYSPAFILDGFGDIIALNPSGLAIYNLEINQLNSSHLLSQHNFIRLLFSPEFEHQRTMMEDFNFGFSRRIVMLFKLWTLKYRTHWYFQRLLPELNRYQGFREHWQSPPFHNEDVFVQHSHVSLTHNNFGHLKFLVNPDHAITAQGDLTLLSFQPLDAHTTETCIQLAQTLGTQAIRVALWPKPPTPTSPVKNL